MEGVDDSVMEDAEDASDVPSASGNSQSRGMYQCAQCERRFSRMDHLSRHIRTHTREKPHRCSTCGKSFARVDLLRRHALRHVDASQQALRNPEDTIRAAKACQPCASAKLKCDDGRPCQRCLRRRLKCDVVLGHQQESSHLDSGAGSQNMLLSPTETHESDAMNGPSNAVAGGSMAMVNEAVQHPGPHRSTMQTSSLRPHVNTMVGEQDVFSTGGQDLTHGYDFGGVDDHNPLEYADFLKDLLFTSPQGIDSEAMGFGLNATRNDPWDADMEVNLGIGDALAAVPFGDIPPVPSPEVHFGEVVDEQRRIVAANSDDLALDAGKKAFSTSVWHWVPTSSDHAAEGQAGLALPTEISSRADTALTLTDDILSKRLVPRDRDRVLSILLERCERQHIVRIASSFPTYNLMEKLLHTALHFLTPGTMQWLHVSTFEPSKIRDELLCALVAYGAILSPVSAIQNLGFAMADILFWAVPDVWGKDNATTRDLQLWQSFALILHLMFWSGSKRRTEIGESHTYPLITMLRGSNVLARDHHQSHWPTIEDERSHLEDKWRAWAVQESKIRLVHHIFIHDAQVSMTRFTGPTMSAAEMNLPLPAAHSLWAARTSQEWRMIYMSSTAVNKPSASLADHVRGALYFAIRPPSAAASVEMRSDLLLLYGLWSMVWNCQLFQSWMTTGDLRIDPRELLSFTPFSLLIKALNALRDEIGFSETDQSEKFLVLNYLNLALYAPLRCLPTFAGKDDKTEAQKVYLTLQQWTSNREGRESIWYAGQILRNARIIPKSQLQGFFAVVIYQASLTLWAFAIVIGARRKRAGPLPDTNIMSEDQSGPALMLDGSVTGGLEGFLAMGDGVPAVSRAALHMSDTNLVPVLFNPGAIMQASIGMLQARSAPRDHTLSRFVESLVQLMDDLSKAAQSLGFG